MTDCAIESGITGDPQTPEPGPVFRITADGSYAARLAAAHTDEPEEGAEPAWFVERWTLDGNSLQELIFVNAGNGRQAGAFSQGF